MLIYPDASGPPEAPTWVRPGRFVRCRYHETARAAWLFGEIPLCNACAYRLRGPDLAPVAPRSRPVGAGVGRVSC